MCGSSIIKNRKELYIITTLLTIIFVVISTPWNFGFTFWADGPEAWIVHYAIGTFLALYVTWAFIRCLVILVGHERHHIQGCDGK